MKNSQLLTCVIATLIFFSACKKKDTQPEPEKIYRYTDSITVDGTNRTYIVNLPPSYYEGTGFPLVLAFHGGGGSGAQFETSSRLTEKASASGFIVVYPDGLAGAGTLGAQTWDAGGCCGYAAAHNIDDVNFVSKLIDKLKAGFSINPKKIYATGHSNGGMLCYRLACELSGKIAAIAPNATTMVVRTPCQPARPVPILHMHSALDTNVPFTGGYGTGISNAWMPSVDSVFGVWSAINACGNPGVTISNTSMYRFKQWSGCTVDPGIQFYLTSDGGHAWPGGLPGSASGDMPSQAINANDLLWEFFQHYQLP